MDYGRLAFIALGTSSWETMVHFILLTNAGVGGHFGVLDTGSAWEDISALCQRIKTEGRSIKELFSPADSKAVPAGFAKLSPYGSAFVLSKKPRERLLQNFGQGFDYSSKANIIAFLNASGGCGGGTGPFLRQLLSPEDHARPRTRIGHLFGILNITAEDARERDNVRYSLPRYCGAMDYQDDIEDANHEKFSPVGFDLLALIDARRLTHQGDDPEKMAEELQEWLRQRTEGSSSYVGAAPVGDLQTLLVADRHAAHVGRIFANYSMSPLGRSRDFGDTYTKLKEIRGFRAYPFVVPHLWPVRDTRSSESVNTPEKLALAIGDALKSYHRGGGCLCGSCTAEDNNGSPSPKAALVFLEGPSGFWGNPRASAFLRQREVINKAASPGPMGALPAPAPRARPADFVLEYLEHRFGPLEYSAVFQCESAADEVRMCIMLWGSAPVGLRILSEKDDTRNREVPMSAGYMQENEVDKELETAALKLTAPSSLSKAFKGWYAQFIARQSRSGVPGPSTYAAGATPGIGTNNRSVASEPDAAPATVPVTVSGIRIEPSPLSLKPTDAPIPKGETGVTGDPSNTEGASLADESSDQIQQSPSHRGPTEDPKRTRRPWRGRH